VDRREGKKENQWNFFYYSPIRTAKRILTEDLSFQNLEYILSKFVFSSYFCSYWHHKLYEAMVTPEGEIPSGFILRSLSFPTTSTSYQFRVEVT
jgi:hypothetical protein